MERVTIQRVGGLAAAVATLLAGAAAIGDGPHASTGAKPPDSVPASPGPTRTFAVQTLTNRLDLRGPFNQNRGKVRLLAFFSPRCGHCQVNARSIQDVILAKVNDPDIVLDVVWMPVTEADSREAIALAATAVPDPRVRHFWDPKTLLNAQLRDAIAFDVNVRFYNVVLLYGRDAQWTDRVPRPGYWMHEYRGAPGPSWNADALATQVMKALAGEPLDTPAPR